MKEDFISRAYTDESQVNIIRLCTFDFTCNLREILFSQAQSVFPLFFFFLSHLLVLSSSILPYYLFCTAIHITSLQITVSVSPVISNDPLCSNHLSSNLSFHYPEFYSSRIYTYFFVLSIGWDL